MRIGADLLSQMLGAASSVRKERRPAGVGGSGNSSGDAGYLQLQIRRQSAIKTIREVDKKESEEVDELTRLIRDGVAKEIKNAILESRRAYEADWKQGRLSKSSKELVQQFKTTAAQFLKLKQALEGLEHKIDMLRRGRDDAEIDPTTLSQIEVLRQQAKKVQPVTVSASSKLIQIRERLDQAIHEDTERINRLTATCERCKKYIPTRQRGKIEVQFNQAIQLPGVEEKIHMLSVLIDRMVQIAPAIRDEEMTRLFTESVQHKNHGDYNAALASLDELFHYERNQIDGHRLRADLFRELGNQLAWQSEIRLISGLDEAEAPDHFAYAEILRKRGGLKEAVGHYERAIKRDPALEYIEALGDTASALGRWHWAEETYRKALSLYPSEKRLVHKIARAVFEDQRTEDALDALRLAIRVEDSQTDTRVYLGRLYRQKGAHMLARESFERAVKIDDTHADAMYWLSLTLYELGEFSSALEYGLQAFERETGRMRNMIQVAKCYQAAGAFEQAVKVLQPIAESEKPSMDIMLSFAECSREAGLTDLGIQHVKAWLQKTPWQPMLKAEYGLLLAEAGRMDEAFQYLNPGGKI